MSQLFEEYRERFTEAINEPAGQRTQLAWELVQERAQAIEALTDEELDEALQAIKEKESAILDKAPHDELFLLSDFEGFPIVEGLRFDMLTIHQEKVRRGLEQPLIVGVSEAQ